MRTRPLQALRLSLERDRRRLLNSAGNDEVDGYWTLALLVGLDIEGEALSFGQRFEAGLFDGDDVHEYIASAFVWLDETVAALGVEEFDSACRSHRETPFPVVASPPVAAARLLGRTFKNGERILMAFVTPPSHRSAERLTQHVIRIGQSKAVEKWQNYFFAGKPINAMASL
jgi:hypothetical protein